MALISGSLTSQGQGYKIEGKITDATDNSELIGVSVVLQKAEDTSSKTGVVTDINGNFVINQLDAGNYLFRASYVGFQNYTQTINLNKDQNLGIISMKVTNTQLQNVTITGEQIRVQQQGDTTSFNAGAYKTNPDANAEDLINKMPGISTEGGSIKANGEDVKQVLVDGKPFFGDDPNAAIKNLPAEIIDKIQVFDKLSDQAQLTGFADGNEQKTINIVTKPGKNTGQFGKIYAGYGARDLGLKENFYSAGGNLNYFKGDRRISIIALSNNINQQNFSTDDLLGVVSSNSGSGRSGGGNRGGRSRRSGNSAYGRGSDASNFLVGQQAGITQTHSAGINYSDNWATNIRVSGSYFFNHTSNTNTNSLTRNYFGGADSNIIYKEYSTTTTRNTNHRANLRIEYDIDSANSLIFTPKLSYQQNESLRELAGNSRYPDSTLLNSTTNRNTANNDGYNLGANLVYRHKFDKKGRTLSLNLNGALNNRTGDGTTYSLNQYLSDTSSGFDSTLLAQRYDLTSKTQSLSANITYSEPMGKNSQLMINYAPSRSHSTSDKETMNENGGAYIDFDSSLSNKFDNTYTTQRGGLTWQFRKEKLMLMAGANYQYATLDGNQYYPSDFTVNRNFSNLLPTAMLNYRFSKTENIRLMYRTNTNAPNISQLQNVFDVTNPLLVKTGNAALAQDYTHTLIFRYGKTNTAKATNLFAMLYGSYVNNYIANETVYPTQNIVLAENVVLSEGSQISRPVNLNGYFSGRSFFTYGMPLRPIKTNLNLNLGFNYSRQPGKIRYIKTYEELIAGTDGITNISDNYAVNAGVVFSSNISENIDFTLSYSGYYNMVRNSIQTQSDNNYYNHTASARINYLFLDRFVFNTTATHTLYSGLSAGYNQSFLLWNAAMGYKFLPDKSLDVRLSVYDLLNQNRAIERTVTETYIEDSYTNVLQRYFMLQATYTLRHFGSGKNKTTDVVAPAEDYGGQGPRHRRGGDE